jgi:hypothetical protein
MKKITLLVCMIAALAFTTHAQYYYLSFLNAGENPNGLNNDIEQPSATSAGWATLQATSATPVWSPNATIPFSFNFNGSPMTTFKVSTSGVLTFTTGAVAVPASTSAALPNASIPDNSVCVWGLSGVGANDKILTKTFGTAPNRQFWVQFNSYSCPSSTGWTYWSIVFEETTNNIYVVDHRSYLAPLALSIGIQLNSTTAYAVAGSPALGSNATTTADDTPIDNSYYMFAYGIQPANDARLNQLTNVIYVGTPGNVNITGKIRNLGSATINAITIKYQSGANVYTFPANLNIPSGGLGNFTHGTPLNIPSPGAYPVTVWVELAGDNNHSNDTLNTTINGASFMPVHNVFFEEATGTWCGWCPRGAVFMDSLFVVHPTTALLSAVHNADPMVVSTYDAAMGGLIGGYPSGLVDRKAIDVDPSTFFTEYANHIGDFGVANLNVNSTFNTTTRLATIDVSGTFAVDLSGDYRYSVVVTEDDVTGTTASFNQANYYSYMSQNLPLVGAGHDWQNSPNPIPAANMQYDHVARALLGGFAGQAGSLPSTILANSTQNYTFNYTVPVAYNVNNMNIIGLLIENSTGYVLNSARFDFPTGVNEPVQHTSSFSVNVYPNPMNNNGTVQIELLKASTVKMEIVDMQGRMILSKENQLASGKHYYDLGQENLGSGLYNVTIKAGEESITKRFVVSK